MLTKATTKLIRSLQQKKYRKKSNLFVVEGKKSVEEFLKSDFTLKYFFVSKAFHSLFPQAEICSEKDLKNLSSLATNPNIIAVFEQKEFELPTQIDHIHFALDGIQDPGNLGTIIRLADWFGMRYIFCNENTVDIYNPKVIQASMGSLTRVKVHYLNLSEYIKEQKVPVLGTFMNGDNIYKTEFPQHGFLVMGNEANGISNKIEALCTQKITIPQRGNGTESLNVAIASAIIAGEIFREI